MSNSIIKFDKFQESVILDCGGPVFSSKKYYSVPNNLTTFKFGFDSMTEEFLANEDINIFKANFIAAVKRYRYPKEEAQKVLSECIATMIAHGNTTEVKNTNNF